MSTIATLTVDLFANTARYVSQIDKVKEQNRRLESSFGRLKEAARGVFAGVGIGAVAAFTASAGAAAEQVLNLADRLRVSTSELQALQYAAEQTGLPFETLTSSVTRLYRGLDEFFQGSGEAGEALRRLGIDAESFARLGLEAQLSVLARGFSALHDPISSAAIAQELFGRGGAELLPFLQQGADGIEALTQRFRDLGLELDRTTLARLDASADAMDDLGRIARANLSESVAHLDGVLVGLTETLRIVASIAGPVLGFAFNAFAGTVNAVKGALTGLVGSFQIMLTHLPAVGRHFESSAGLLADLSNRYFATAEASFRYALGLERVAAAEQQVAGARRGTLANPFELPEITVSAAGPRRIAQQAAEEEARLIESVMAASRDAAARIDPFAEREPYSALPRAVREQMDALGDSYFKMQEMQAQAAEEAARAARRIEDAWRNAAQAMNDTFVDRLLQLRGNTRDFLMDMLRMIAQSQLRQALTDLFGAGGVFGAGGLFGALKTGIGALFGGGRAAGGPVRAGRIYRVNEHVAGSEWFAPSVDGTVLRADQVLAGGGSRGLIYAPVINVDSRADRQQVIADVQAVVAQSQRAFAEQLYRSNPYLRG